MRTFDDLVNFADDNRAVYDQILDLMKESYKTEDFKIVPFIGAGLTSFVYPTWTNALRQIAAALGNPDAFTKEMEKKSPDLEVAAENLWKKGGQGIGPILRDQVFNIDKLKGKNLRRQLVNILPAMFPDSLLITTNFDKVIEEVFSSHGQAIHPVYPEANTDFLGDITIRNNISCLFKVHGDIYLNPDKIVFPKSAYDRVYRQDTELVETLGTIFAKRSMLFLGASLETDRTLDLLKRVRVKDPTVPHFAILSCGESDQHRRSEFLHEHGISAFFFPPGEYISLSIVLEYLFEVANRPSFEVFSPKLGAKRNVSNRFDWRSEFTAFTGRAKELEQLNNFLNNTQSAAIQDQITWWALTGPGGMGKSRLAGQFQDQLPALWKVCDLSKPTGLTLDSLSAKVDQCGNNVLIIADYAQNLTGIFSDWINTQTGKAGHRRARILLLQRENYDQSSRASQNPKGLAEVAPNPPWLQNMLNSYPNVMEHAYQAQSLTLGQLTEDELKGLMRSFADNLRGSDGVIQDLSPETQQRVLERLKDIDPEFLRPLFVLFLTDACLRGEDPLKWDQDEVLSHFSKREMERLHDNLKTLYLDNTKTAKAADFAQFNSLVLLATVLYGLLLDPEDDLPEHCLNIKNKLFNLSVTNEHFLEALTDYGLAEKIASDGKLLYLIPPMKPDLLGEHLVFEHFSSTDPVYSKVLPPIKKLNDQSSFKHKISDFFARLGSHYLLPKNWLQSFSCLDSVSRGLMTGLGNQALDGVSPEKLYPVADTLMAGNKENENLAMVYAGFLSAISYKCERVAEINIAVNQIEELYRQFPASQEIAFVFAIGLVSLTARQETAREVSLSVDRIKELYRQFPASQEIALRLARGLVNLTIRQETAQEVSLSVDRIEELYRQFPATQEIALRLARGLVSLTNRQETAREVSLSVDRIEELYRQFPASQEIALRLARGLVNLTVEQETAQEVSLSVARIEELYRQFPATQEIAEAFARGLVSLTNRQETAQERACSVDRIEELYRQFPASQEIALEFAKGLVNLTVEQETAREVSLSVARIEELYRQFPGSQEIALEFVDGLQNLMKVISDEALIEELKSKIEELRRRFGLNN